MTSEQAGRPYVLGLDIGVASVGWAMVEADPKGRQQRIIRAGVHLFEAGVDGGQQDPQTAVAKGKEQSPAAPRRTARQQRRQIWRRAYRKRLLLKRLIRHGLLPQPVDRLDSPEDIHEYLQKLDADLRAKWEAAEAQGDHRTAQLLPYRLRAEALRRALEPFEVGRALYHLAQRRGFLSNRKTDDEAAGGDDEDAGEIKKAVSKLAEKMQEAGAETLGAYFASLDPTAADAQRIRGRWTGRSMYEHEFNRIWDEQSLHHPAAMTGEARAEIHEAIFSQRPLKSQRHLIGRCSLMPNKRRAPLADRLSQRFRMLQKVNDLEVRRTDTGEVFRLTEDQRAAAVRRLSEGDATFAQLRKAALPKMRNIRFNFETEGEKKLPGLRTDAKLREVFGERWDALSERDRDAVVEDCLSFDRVDAMEKRGREHWGLSAEAARAFARVKLEEGYANLSRAAMRRLIPELESGTQYAKARQSVFPESFLSTEPVDELPSVAEAFDDPVSPAVSRALSELRKVVNAIVRRYGKPEHVRIELARDLKSGRKRREKISRNIAARRKERDDAAARLLERYPGRADNETDKLKLRLADECGWQCPYTGRCFGWDDVFGAHPTVDIEHIWPFKRSLDNSYLNKTLCCVEENRTVKRDHLPAEVYSDEKMQEILQRVANFKGDAVQIKLQRFRAEAIPAGFTERHLNESRYISRKATEYLALLYGGLSDQEHRRRVHVTTGGLTGWLRREWGLNAILSEDDEKERDDHRHHAVDAIITAFTTPATVKKLEEAAAEADDNGARRLFAGIDPPFDFASARDAVEAIVVTHRQQRKARGKFHKDTIYSRPFRSKKGNGRHRVRKELHKLTEGEIDAIIDPGIRQAVHDAYTRRKKQGVKSPAQAFSERAQRPVDPHGNRIRRVRLHTKAAPVPIGTDRRDRKKRGATKRRHVALEANHHTVIMAKLDPEGNEKTWQDQPVALFDAMNRVKNNQPLVCRDAPDGCRFKFTLAVNDYIEMDRAEGEGRSIYRVLNISAGDIEVREHQDGRTRETIKAQKGRRERVRGSALFRRNARKVHVNYLGEVYDAGG